PSVWTPALGRPGADDGRVFRPVHLLYDYRPGGHAEPPERAGRLRRGDRLRLRGPDDGARRLRALLFAARRQRRPRPALTPGGRALSTQPKVGEGRQPF